MNALEVKPGEKYNRLTVLKHPQGTHVFVRCTCGVKKYVSTSHMVSGRTKSCSCLKNELARQRITALNKSGQPGFRHGYSRTPEYQAYYNARSRCNDPSDKDYKFYGARHIKFKFKTFQAWIAELGNRPSPMHSVDRIDSYGNYEPGNVRWTTWDIQVKNKRSNTKQT